MCIFYSPLSETWALFFEPPTRGFSVRRSNLELTEDRPTGSEAAGCLVAIARSMPCHFSAEPLWGIEIPGDRRTVTTVRKNGGSSGE